MKMNTIIKLPDGRIGTICWRHLDGEGGVFGETFFDCEENITDDLPAPEFMLRDKGIEKSLRRGGHRNDLECVGEEYEIIKLPKQMEKQ